jgi:hypothetical protein
MATVNLGRIKPVFRGAYNSSTAYVVDDIVTDSNETFICILASTGNATSNATYWTKLAAKGTDGTDVGTTLTTQGDILYRDGSGLQRLAKGTSGNVLTQGTNHPEWGTVSSDWVKIARTDITAVSSISFQDIFNNTTYNTYKIFIQQFGCDTAQGGFYYRWLTSGSTEDTTATYWAWQDGAYFYFSDNSSGYNKDSSRDQTKGNLSGWGGYTNNTDHAGMNNYELTLFDPYRNKTHSSVWGGSVNIVSQYCYEGGSDNRYHVVANMGQFQKNTTTKSGIKFYWSSGSFLASGTIQIYGLKA